MLDRLPMCLQSHIVLSYLNWEAWIHVSSTTPTLKNLIQSWEEDQKNENYRIRNDPCFPKTARVSTLTNCLNLHPRRFFLDCQDRHYIHELVEGIGTDPTLQDDFSQGQYRLFEASINHDFGIFLYNRLLACVKSVSSSRCSATTRAIVRKLAWNVYHQDPCVFSDMQCRLKGIQRQLTIKPLIAWMHVARLTCVFPGILNDTWLLPCLSHLVTAVVKLNNDPCCRHISDDELHRVWDARRHVGCETKKARALVEIQTTLARELFVVHNILRCLCSYTSLPRTFLDTVTHLVKSINVAPGDHRLDLVYRLSYIGSCVQKLIDFHGEKRPVHSDQHKRRRL